MRVLFKFLLNNRFFRRSSLIITDLSIILFVFLYLSSTIIIQSEFINLRLLLIFFLIIAPIFYLSTGQYSGVTRYIRTKQFSRLFIRNTAYLILIYFLARYILKINYIPKVFWINYWTLLNLLQMFSRIVARDFILKNENNNNSSKSNSNIVIYGAGEGGAQLAEYLQFNREIKILFFVDDNPNLWSRSLNGFCIKSPNAISLLNDKIDQIHIAIPSITKEERKKIVTKLIKYKIPFYSVPSLLELSNQNLKIHSLKPIEIEDLLGRELIQIDKKYLLEALSNKIICITGAGGSIGSELTKQIISLKPQTILMIDNSEASLYEINQKIKDLNIKGIKLLPILGNVCDYKFIKNIFNKYQVDIVFHSAAYKHVPLVELNSVQGILNNVLSTRTICRASSNTKVQQVILISSDKAVRPTNIMGATKRISELIIQASDIEQQRKIAINKDISKKCFCMVRFGNVLNSSGSVIPLFTKQISVGGPITLTHKEVIRYFITISEAVELVLHTSFIAEGGDVFLLDMGKPVKVESLAKQMILLSGKTIKDKDNPRGEIEIITTKLRAGEKLYEELLIDATSIPTIHPCIFKAFEKSIQPEDLWPLIDKLINAALNQDENQAFDLLTTLVPEWTRD